jgi:quinol monooxygenase YgiN
MLILSVLFRVPPGELEALRPAMAVIIKATRAEPGNILFTLAEDVLEPGLIRAFEVFRDDEALKAHGASEHFKAWRAVSGQYAREERRLFDATMRP